MAAAAALSKPEGIASMVSGLKDNVREASGEGSIIAKLGWALSLHALYVVLPRDDLPPVQHLIEDLLRAMATIFDVASATQVCQTFPLMIS